MNVEISQNTEGEKQNGRQKYQLLQFVADFSACQYHFHFIGGQPSPHPRVYPIPSENEPRYDGNYCPSLHIGVFRGNLDDDGSKGV